MSIRLYEEIERRRQEIEPDQLHDDLLWRIAALTEHRGEIDLTLPENRRAFSEVIDAYRPDGFDFILAPLGGVSHCCCDHEASRIALSGFLTSDGTAMAELARVIRLKERYAYHSHLKVHARFRGNRIAPRTFVKSVALYDRLGLEQIRLRAAFSGSWYWAQWGFSFADKADLVRLQTHTQGVVDLFGGGLDVSTFVRPSQFFYLGDGFEVRIDDLMAAMPSEADRYQEIAALNGIGIHDWIPFGRAVMLTGPAWDACLNLSSQSADRLIFDDLARRMVTD